MAKTLLLSDKMLKISEVMAESAVVEYEERDASENLIPVAPAVTQPPPVEESSPEVKKETLYERAKRVKSLITVEPILACYVMPSVLAGLATQNLNLEKACRVNLKFGEEICDALSRRETANITYYEFEVQRLVASMGAWKSILQTALPCMIILFLGAWSDKTGRRKICILMPIIGEFMSSVSLLVNSYFFYELPMEAAMFSEALFPALMGGWFTMFVGVFSYIADITTEESRTFRVGVLNLCMSLGVPVGMALSGILLREIGYYGVFSTSATLYLISFTYAYFKVEEPNKLNPANKADLDVGFFRSFFDLNHVRDTFRVAFRHGPNHRRLKVSLLFVVVFVIFGPLHGEMSVLYLFTRYRFNWNEVEFSFYSTYCIVTNLIGTVFSLSVFSKYLKLDDTIIAIISSMSKIFSSFAYAFATTTFEIYMAPIIEIFNGTSFIAMRSIASKLVSSEELGKVNSLFGLAEAMSPLVYGPLYAKVYAATIRILPGTVFLLGAALTAPAIFIFAWMYCMAKRDEKQKDGENVEPEPTEKEVKLLNPSIDPKLNIQSAAY